MATQSINRDRTTPHVYTIYQPAKYDQTYYNLATIISEIDPYRLLTIFSNPIYDNRFLTIEKYRIWVSIFGEYSVKSMKLSEYKEYLINSLLILWAEYEYPYE